ncbi:MAG: hypothetical protein ABIT61_06785 [Steroidobacteraceae bacterium]
MKFGSGTWHSVTALGKVQRQYADPVSQQAGYFGTIEEAGGRAIVSLCVRVTRSQGHRSRALLRRCGLGQGWGTGIFERKPDAKRGDGSPLRWLWLTDISA